MRDLFGLSLRELNYIAQALAISGLWSLAILLAAYAVLVGLVRL